MQGKKYLQRPKQKISFFTTVLKAEKEVQTKLRKCAEFSFCILVCSLKIIYHFIARKLVWLEASCTTLIRGPTKKSGIWFLHCIPKYKKRIPCTFLRTWAGRLIRAAYNDFQKHSNVYFCIYNVMKHRIWLYLTQLHNNHTYPLCMADLYWSCSSPPSQNKK